jgi:hypothetical protein
MGNLKTRKLKWTMRKFNSRGECLAISSLRATCADTVLSCIRILYLVSDLSGRNTEQYPNLPFIDSASAGSLVMGRTKYNVRLVSVRESIHSDHHLVEQDG